MNSDSLTLHPPAKINLVLRVVGRRPDGFHELETVMVRTTLCDTLEITRNDSPGITLSCSDPTLPTNSDNLVVKAVELFLSRHPQPFGIRMHLEKKIPHGGGLGGGSSDAAYALDGINQLAGSPLDPAALQSMIAEIGSDTAFFLGPPAALCKGRGEILEPFDLAETPRRCVLINPGFGVNTAWAYKTYAALPPEKKTGEPCATYSWGEMRNDLEPPVFEKYLLLPEIKSWLRSQPGVCTAMMSGSGSTMFALLEETTDATALESAFRARFGTSAFFAEVRLAE